jgi:hypothetical protein
MSRLEWLKAVSRPAGTRHEAYCDGSVGVFRPVRSIYVPRVSRFMLAEQQSNATGTPFPIPMHNAVLILFPLILPEF